MVRAFGLQDLYNQSLITIKDQEVKVGLLSWFGGSCPAQVFRRPRKISRRGPRQDADIG